MNNINFNSDNIFNNLKTNFLFNLKTGNFIIDTFISSLLFGIIGFICNKFEFSNFIQFIKNKFFKNKLNKYPFNIQYIGFNSQSKYSVQSNYPDSIYALLYFIEKNQQNDINSLCELIPKSNILCVFDSIKNIDKNKTDIMYSINTEEPFYINDNIICSYSKTMDEKSLNKESLYTLYEVKYILYSDNIQNIKTFMKQILSEYTFYLENKVNISQKILNYVKYDDNELFFKEYNFKSTKTFNNIFFENKKLLINNINNFINNENLYNIRGLPYKFTLLLEGLPGCGKTSIIKAIANYTNRFIINVNLNKIKTSVEFEEIFYTGKFNNIKIPYNKRIYILEDIDAMSDIVDERSNQLNIENEIFKNFNINFDNNDLKKFIQEHAYSTVQKFKNDNLTLSTMLNVFDGIHELNGVMIIITTNYIDKLDSALIRPGRIDFKLNFKKATSENLINIIKNYFQIDIINFNYD